MFGGEVTICTPPERKIGKAKGTLFAVARGVYHREVMDEEAGQKVRKPVFCGLVAFGAARDALLEAKVNDRYRITGELTREDYTREDGSAGSDLKLRIEMIYPLETAEKIGPEVGPALVGFDPRADDEL